MAKKLFQDAIEVLDREIARCEQHSEYCERAKVDGYLRAKHLLVEERKRRQ